MLDIKVRYKTFYQGISIPKFIEDWVSVEVDDTEERIKNVIISNYYDNHETYDRVFDSYVELERGKYHN